MPRQTQQGTKPKRRTPKAVEPMRRFRSIPPQMGPKARAKYLARDDVKRWLRKNARKLRVVDVRAVAQLKPEIIEWAEIYHVLETSHGKVLKCRLICGDPPPRIPFRKKPQED